MVYCPRCGSNNERDFFFCSECGNDIRINQNKLKKTTHSVTKNHSKFGVILTVFIILCLVLVGLYFYADHFHLTGLKREKQAISNLTSQKHKQLPKKSTKPVTNLSLSDPLADILDVIPVSAYYYSFGNREYSEDLRMYRKEGWDVLIVNVIIGNKTHLFMPFPPQSLQSYSKTDASLKLVSSDGYEYKGWFAQDMLENVTNVLPPYFYLCNFIKDYFDSCALEKLRVVFMVPKNIKNYKFVFENNSPIDISTLIGNNIEHQVMPELEKRYQEVYKDKIDDVDIKFGTNAFIKINDVSFSNQLLSVNVVLENKGGYNELYNGHRNHKVYVINSSGVFYSVGNFSTWNPDSIPPKSTLNRNWSRIDFPGGHSTVSNPKYLIVYDTKNPQSSHVFNLDQ